MTRRRALFWFTIAAAGCQAPPPDRVVHAQVGALAQGTPLAFYAEAAGGVASSVDEAGVPSFIFDQGRAAPPAGASHEQAARFHAARYRQALGLSPAALDLLSPSLIADRGAQGVVVHLEQRALGRAIYRRELRLLLRPDHTLVALSGRAHPNPPLLVGAAAHRAPEEAIAGALSHAVSQIVPASRVVDSGERDGDRDFFRVAPGGGVAVPDRVMLRRVLYPQAGALRPAYAIDLYVGRTDSADSEAWGYLIAEDDGSILERVSRTASDAFNYRVWAWSTGDLRPLDGPFQDWTPHPTGRPDLSYPPWVVPPVIAMEGFNHNPQGRDDPWLTAATTQSAGNNIDAYTDRYPPDGLGGGDFRATTTGTETFDRYYDLFNVPTASNDQAMAGIIQAFYTTNWLHDYWYDSGFDEQAGNAQQNNYNRGGAANDRMQVQTQDNESIGTRDNSNMSTPPDGLGPRMQIYVWSGHETRTLHTSPPDADPTSGSATFGPAGFDLTGTLSDVDDGALPSATDACEAIRNDVSGKVALIDRGTCTFKKKAINAQNAGAVAVLIANNITGNPPQMGNGDPMTAVLNIPILSTTKDAGAALRKAMTNGPVTVRMARTRDIDRDGSLDDQVICHEWGHYLHHRLADCGGAQQCNAMSEGYADFNALHTQARDGDNLDGTFAVGIYASAQFDDPAYFGIRRQPYSVDFKKNGLTFKDIGDGVALPERQVRNVVGAPNSEVHNAGEIWATMLWEVYVGLQKDGLTRNPPRTFDQVRRTMADYIVMGHQMEPQDATYTESRDAIMAAAGAVDPQDELVIAQAFARRGAGTCADSPPRSSATLVEVVEGFTVQPRLTIGDVTLDDSAMSCDNDGVLDAGERGKIVINVSNGALQPLVGATLTLSTTTPQVSFTGPTTFSIPPLDPFATMQVTTEVAVDPAMADPGTFTLNLAPSSDAACTGEKRDVTWRINYDIGVASSATDEVVPGDSSWTATGGDAASAVWGIAPAEDQNLVLYGADLGQMTDTAFESPDLQVSSTDFFLIQFEHRFSFDARDVGGTRTYFDGGVLELSEDEGATWQDFSTWVTPGYGGILTTTSDNPLAKRWAFVDKNFAWPARERVTMNFLDALAGKTVKVRFRVATDSSLGEAGWSIDNVAFSGITNTPFSGSTFDAGKCGTGPRGPNANATGCSIAPRGTALPLALLVAPLGLLARRRRR